MAIGKRVDDVKVSYVSHMGTDLTVVNAARVSFDKFKDEFDEKDEKLIKYLADHAHWTPFAHPQLTFRVDAPVPIRTQCFRHKVGFAENEVSRRYVSDIPSVFTPLWRKRHESAKQGSAEEFSDPEQIQFRSLYEQSVSQALFSYEKMIDAGVCPEQARLILPQGMMTSWIWTSSLAGYARFCSQRLDPHAQKEVARIAEKISSIVGALFPISWKYLIKK